MNLERHHETRILRLDSGHLPVFLYCLNGLLVDTGFSRCRADVLDFLREEKPSQAAVTHHHEDHSGNVASVIAQGVKVWAPAAGITEIADGFAVEYYRRRIWGRPEHAVCEPMPAQLRAGNIDLDVVAAPGHSHDMTVLHSAQRGWLFTGDLFIARRLKLLRNDEDPSALIASIDRVLQLEFDTLFCAHRGVVKDARAQLQAKRDYLAGIRDQVRELAREGLSARRITRRIFGRETAMYYSTLGKFSAINFTRKFLAEIHPG